MWYLGHDGENFYTYLLLYLVTKCRSFGSTALKNVVSVESNYFFWYSRIWTEKHWHPYLLEGYICHLKFLLKSVIRALYSLRIMLGIFQPWLLCRIIVVSQNVMNPSYQVIFSKWWFFHIRNAEMDGEKKYNTIKRKIYNDYVEII